MVSEVKCALMVGTFRIDKNTGEVIEMLSWARRQTRAPRGMIWHVEEFETGRRYYLDHKEVGRPVPPLEIIARAAQG